MEKGAMSVFHSLEILRFKVWDFVANEPEGVERKTTACMKRYDYENVVSWSVLTFSRGLGR